MLINVTGSALEAGRKRCMPWGGISQNDKVRQQTKRAREGGKSEGEGSSAERR